MKKIAVSAAILCCAVACWSQAYYEASGQTQVFTLTAGAKGGWSTAIKDGPAVHAELNNGIRVKTLRSVVIVTMPSKQKESADISLYDIKGRQVYRQLGMTGTSMRIGTQSFAPGIYSMIIRAGGQSYSRRVAVYGRGE
jgi:hypothetical protein